MRVFNAKFNGNWLVAILSWLEQFLPSYQRISTNEFNGFLYTNFVNRNSTMNKLFLNESWIWSTNKINTTFQLSTRNNLPTVKFVFMKSGYDYISGQQAKSKKRICEHKRSLEWSYFQQNATTLSVHNIPAAAFAHWLRKNIKFFVAFARNMWYYGPKVVRLISFGLEVLILPWLRGKWAAGPNCH